MRRTVSIRTYTLIFAALMTLVLATTLLAMVDLGPFTMVVAIAIAATKAALIATFFMQALYESKLVRVIIGGGVVWFTIMETLTLADYMTRGWVSHLGGK